MYFTATAAQMKKLDGTAIRDRGISSLLLMENAARAVADRVCPPSSHPLLRVALFCGPGNNGGDGLAAARLLLERGCDLRVFLVGDRDKMTPDCRTNEALLLAAGCTPELYSPDQWDQEDWLLTCHCVVDALFGVGLSRPVSGDFLHAIRRINRVRAKVVSCDIPSGLNADTGEIMGEAVRADVTVTFTCPKPGLYLGEGRACSGQVEVEDIGIPFQLECEQIRSSPAPAFVPTWESFPLPRRKRTAHKGDFGKVMILAGSVDYTGAPILAARGAVRTGAGLVCLGVPSEVYPIVAAKCCEAMPFPLPHTYGELLARTEGCSALLIGPGLGRAPETEALVRRLLRDITIPVILDADGINALEGHTHILKERTAPTVLTPHDGEFRRLTGCDLPIRDRLTAARDFAAEHRCTLILKGHCTVTAAPDGTAYLNPTGNPGMARGGSGDVLAGMLAALVGQKQLEESYPTLAQRCALGVYYHGEAGDLCARELGEYAMTPGDMIAALPKILSAHEADG